MLIALYAKDSASRPRTLEAQIAYPIAMRESANALDFVLRHIKPERLSVDARWAAQTEIIAHQRQLASTGEGPVRQLREILRQLGWDLKIPDPPEIVSLIEKKEREIRSFTAGSIKEFEVLTRFRPQRDPYPLTIGGTLYQVTVSPVSALPNLNFIGAKALARYLEYLGLAKKGAGELAAVLADWIDADDFTTLAGAESTYYQLQPWSYLPRNGPIQHWDELLYMKGSSPDLIAFLRRNFVIHSRGPRVHFDHVDPEQIAVLADLEVEVVKAALDHIRNPTPTQRDLRLADVIGLQAARKFEDVATNLVGDDDPLIVELAGPRLKMTAVFDPRTKSLLDLVHSGRGE
ncbi:MAG: hypothetical protein ACT4P2_07680 [Pseudomonadota bacterium]